MDYARRARSAKRQREVAVDIFRGEKYINNPPIVVAVVKQGRITSFLCNHPVGLAEIQAPRNIEADQIFRHLSQRPRFITGFYNPGVIAEIMEPLNFRKTPGIRL